MLNDDEGPRDWEIEDEEPPESLKRKWEEEEASEKKSAVCPSCKKETPAENLTCIFCEEILLRECGSIRGFLVWVKRLFKKG